MNKLVIEPELLESLYWGNGYSTPGIANIFGCSDETIRCWMTKYDIPRRGKVIVEPDLLWNLYWGNGYTIWQIANLFDCGYNTIKRRMIKYAIPRRRSADLIFSDRQKEIFEGCMLGDGNLEWHTNYCGFRNADIHKEYLDWLQKLLGVEGFSKITPRYHFVGAKSPFVYQLRTNVIPSLRDEYKRWYPNGAGTIGNIHHKIIPKDIELTLIKLLFWYIGDGNYHKRDNIARFTNSFGFDEWELLSKKMYKVLDVDSGISIWGNGKDSMDNQRYNLYLNKVVTKKFFDMVDRLGFRIPECYQYKFGR